MRSLGEFFVKKKMRSFFLKERSFVHTGIVHVSGDRGGVNPGQDNKKIFSGWEIDFFDTSQGSESDQK